VKRPGSGPPPIFRSATTDRQSRKTRKRAGRSVFISYSWDNPAHQEWVEEFAFRLEASGIEVRIDQWHLKLGDSIARFMEAAIESSDFVLLICTPRYRLRADKREGGVGYEHDLMTAHRLASGEYAKFIPVLRAGTWYTATPKWLAGHLGVDLRGTNYGEDNFQNLVDHLLNSPLRGQ
jgi:TIR domain